MLNHATMDAPTDSEREPEAVLEVRSLHVHFGTQSGPVEAISDVSLRINANEVVGVVGESGCGKSVLAQSIMRLHDEAFVAYEGAIDYQGRDVLRMSRRQLRQFRGEEVAMIFQDPLNSLNPVVKIGVQISETLRLHRRMSKKAARSEAVELLRRTGVPAPDRRVDEYPHQLSGGMRQRVMIAMALACKPTLLIADEPTTALDVTVQAQVLDLVREVRRELGMSLIFISHDLGVVAELCDRLVVMYLGQVIEEGTLEEVFARPLHPYTQGLMRSSPDMKTAKDEVLYAIPGTVPPLSEVPSGCRFATRCEFRTEKCASAPSLRGDQGGHRVRCWFAEAIADGSHGPTVDPALSAPRTARRGDGR
jgi:peptide/nickel transport system ATP-binding protein